ncbi:hypothetical protein FACS1894208_08990 [Clostridia bacterium]|nr:hypothetical protein FACS1894208_08990 [Clostridia bacterium]
MTEISFEAAKARTALEDVRYFYVVHGVIPELMPNVAYRRVKGALERERKTLKCPHCEKKLTDTDAETRVELYQHPVRVAAHCQFYLKCFHCGSEVGINIA